MICTHLGIKIFYRILKARLGVYPHFVFLLKKQVLFPLHNEEPTIGLSLEAVMKFENGKHTLEERIFPSEV
jgi:hypothetical protein